MVREMSALAILRTVGTFYTYPRRGLVTLTDTPIGHSASTRPGVNPPPTIPNPNPIPVDLLIPNPIPVNLAMIPNPIPIPVIFPSAIPNPNPIPISSY